MRRGTIVAFDGATWTAAIRYDGAGLAAQPAVPVARSLAAWQLPVGGRVVVAVFDPFVADACCVVAALDGAYPSARVFNTATIGIPNATPTALTFDSDRWDSAGLHTAASRLTAGTAGRYLIVGHAAFAANTAGGRSLTLRHNGTTDVATLSGPPRSDGLWTGSLPAILDLAAGDYVELVAEQSSGGALNVVAIGDSSPELAISWLGDA